MILYHSNLPADFQAKSDLDIAEIIIIPKPKNFKYDFLCISNKIHHGDS